MKLEPVYLVAPRARIPTRRAFVLAGLAGAAGVGCGFVAGRALAGPAGDAPPDPGSAPVDAELLARIQWAERLAQRSDVDELLANLPALLGVVDEAASRGLDSDVMWRAVAKTARAVADDGSVPWRAPAARALVRLLERRPGAVTTDLQGRLQTIGERRR